MALLTIPSSIRSASSRWLGAGDVAPGCGAQIGRPPCAAVLDRLQLVRSQPVSGDIGPGDAAGSIELLGEHDDLEPGVALRGSRDQLVVREPAGGADRVHVEVVARLAPAVESRDLQPVVGSDVQPSELRCSTGLLDPIATLSQVAATWSTLAPNAVTSWLVVNRSTSSVGRSITPCSRIAPDPARANPWRPASAIRAT
ncbi:MAG: hypothetical protein ACLGIA_10935 [Actinomycetes bacterium]